MKKSVMYSETRTWFFDLDMAEGADLDEVMSVLKGTDGFYRYVDDGTSEEIECEWSEVPEDWRGKGDPDYTEEFREVAERELDGKERHGSFQAGRPIMGRGVRTDGACVGSRAVQTEIQFIFRLA